MSPAGIRRHLVEHPPVSGLGYAPARIAEGLEARGLRGGGVRLSCITGAGKRARAAPTSAIRLAEAVAGRPADLILAIAGSASRRRRSASVAMGGGLEWRSLPLTRSLVRLQDRISRSRSVAAGGRRPPIPRACSARNRAQPDRQRDTVSANAGQIRKKSERQARRRRCRRRSGRVRAEKADLRPLPLLRN